MEWITTNSDNDRMNEGNECDSDRMAINGDIDRMASGSDMNRIVTANIDINSTT